MEPSEYILSDYGELPLGYDLVTYAAQQPPYLPLSVIRGLDGRMVTRWEMTEEEFELIVKTGRLYIQVLTFGSRLQPMLPSIEPPELPAMLPEHRVRFIPFDPEREMRLAMIEHALSGVSSLDVYTVLLRRLHPAAQAGLIKAGPTLAGIYDLGEMERALEELRKGRGDAE